MSIKVMTVVWDRFPASGSDLLAMLALADWCDDNGGSLYPSMRAVAEKIRLSEKQARRIVQGFVDAGYLSVVGNANGGAPGTTKQFRLDVKKLVDLPLVGDHKTAKTPPASVTPPMEGRDPSHPAYETPPTHGSQTTIEPPINHHINTVASPVADAPKKPAAMKSSKKSDDFVLPDWINALHWRAWRSHPKLRNASVDQKTIAVEKLANWRKAGEDFAGALENAASSGYQGLFLPENRAGNSRPSATAKASPGKHTGFQNLDYKAGINDDGSFN